ncbi:MAG: hypothetical protein PUD93_06595 [Lachnospiraceae bacterium]|nr:hypothetical protein [Lachnospiraceae bacterium]
MERDFEQEFRQMKQDEIPDLWNRIEAGLSEKTDAVASSGEERSIQHNTEIDREETDRIVPMHKNAWKKWATLAAAVVCLLLVLPAISLTRRNFSQSESSEMADSYVSEEMPYEEEAPCEEQAAEEAMEDTEASSAAEEGIAMEDAAEAETEEMQANKTMREEAKEEMAATGNVDSLEDSAAADTAGSGNITPDEGQFFRPVMVQIADITEAGGEVLYQVVLQETDETGFLSKGSEIEIACNAQTEYDFPRETRQEQVLKTGEEYQVSLCYEDGRFVVLTVAICSISE